MAIDVQLTSRCDAHSRGRRLHRGSFPGTAISWWKSRAVVVPLVAACYCVVVVVVVGVLRFLAGHALGPDHGGVGVREGLAVGQGREGLASAVLVGELGAGLLREESEVDVPSVLGTVGADEVFDLLLLLQPSVVIVLELVIAALGHFLEFPFLLLFLLVVVVGVAVDAVLHALAHVAVVFADFLVEVITLVLAVADTVAVFLLVLAGVFLILLNGLEVRREVIVHADDVVSVSLAAPSGTLHGASVRGTQTESHETLGGNAHVLIAIGLLVPLLGVVTSLEFEGHVGDPGVVDLLVVVEATGLGHDLLSDLGGGRYGGLGDGVGGQFAGSDLRLDLFAGAGGGEADGGREDGERELHGFSVLIFYCVFVYEFLL
mmetsp:Transcript_1774/g.3938  ORF Transcript_1774/g.3938 Transcript_1774/m.3938 type:complete len:375 (+) Transcript_1774:916-2040(+)